jgi:outer membrane biosynthesis protein TonB
MSNQESKKSKKSKPKPEPEPESRPEPEPEPEPESEESLEYEYPDPMLDGPEVFGGMLNGILGNYFEYEHADGTTLNAVDVLLLIRQSINEHTDAIKELTAVVAKITPNTGS